MIILSFALALTSFVMAKGLVETKDASNLAILVGVADDLPGVAKDMRRIRGLVKRPGYGYLVTEHRDKKAIADDVVREVEAYARGAGSRGSLFFYFTGHGDPGTIAMGDRDLGVGELRDAIARGRTGMGPLPRLTIWIDSCRSGSFIEPWPVDALVAELNGAPIAKLFAFAASRADEDSFSSDDGGDFTVAIDKAYRGMKGLGTLGDLVARVRGLVTDAHPTERFVPASLAREPLVD